MFLKRKLKNKLKAAARFAQTQEFHRQLGDIYFRLKQWYPAIAEYRTSLTIGNEEPNILLSLAKAYLAGGYYDYSIFICEKIFKKGKDEVVNQAHKIRAKAENNKNISLERISPNRYQRLKRLADHIDNLYGNSDISILDVGGGDGLLCLFLPNVQYVLAEPNINGISGDDLPFAENFFDSVVACHVLEHIPTAERFVFLKQLCEKAKKHVLLFNPFFDPKGHEGLILMEELTGAQWAKEHLLCTMPKLEEIKQFVSEIGYSVNIYPNGSKPNSIAYVFLEYYAELVSRQNDLERINILFNSLFYDNMSEHYPNDYLIEIRVGD